MLGNIAGRTVGPGQPAFVIAEIGLNHGGSLERALQLVDAAAWAGASAVKLQTLFADRLVAAACPAPAHVDASSLRDFFSQFELTLDAHQLVVERARRHGLAVMTTPFAVDVVPALERIGFDAYKIASGDLTYDGLIEAVASTGKPMIVSTGMSALDEVGRALQVARLAGSAWTALLHCVSAYPAPVESQNLRAIATLADAFGLPAGLSDHGCGLNSAITAAALGACVYERHLVLADDHEAIDRPVSSTPSELRQIIQAMERTRIALGSGAKTCQPAEAPNVVASRRGLYATRAMRKGDIVTAADVIALRPQNEVAPSSFGDLVGVRLERDIPAGEGFVAADVAGAAARRIA